MHTDTYRCCPRCGYTLSITRNESKHKFFNNPKIKCPKCSKEIFSDDCYEWVNLTSEEKKFVLAVGNGRYCRVSTLKELNSSIILFACLFFLIFTLYYLSITLKYKRMLFNYKFDERDIINSKDIQESIKRTSDVYYLASLEKCGKKNFGIKI